jgi:2-oxoglutarate ferredoxin oxidoreductase subunit beta
MQIIVVMGDGDALAIGGNHFIHTARRNIDLTAIIVNNNIYGMTGGQSSPTTPLAAYSSTAPYGHVEQPFPITDLAVAAGASFVARSTVYHVTELDKLVELAMLKRGFSVVEVASYCHTTFGRANSLGSPVVMMRRLKELSISKSAAEKIGDALGEDRIVRGVFLDEDKPEFTDLYDRVIEQAGGPVPSRKHAALAGSA